jgi:hypothetical protein
VLKHAIELTELTTAMANLTPPDVSALVWRPTPAEEVAGKSVQTVHLQSFQAAPALRQWSAPELRLLNVVATQTADAAPRLHYRPDTLPGQTLTVSPDFYYQATADELVASNTALPSSSTTTTTTAAAATTTTTTTAAEKKKKKAKKESGDSESDDAARAINPKLSHAASEQRRVERAERRRKTTRAPSSSSPTTSSPSTTTYRKQTRRNSKSSVHGGGGGGGNNSDNATKPGSSKKSSGAALPITCAQCHVFESRLGDALARIDDSELQQQFERARAVRAAQRVQQLRDTDLRLSEERVTALHAQCDAAVAALATQRDAERRLRDTHEAEVEALRGETQRLLDAMVAPKVTMAKGKRKSSATTTAASTAMATAAAANDVDQTATAAEVADLRRKLAVATDALTDARRETAKQTELARRARRVQETVAASLAAETERCRQVENSLVAAKHKVATLASELDDAADAAVAGDVAYARFADDADKLHTRLEALNAEAAAVREEKMQLAQQYAALAQLAAQRGGMPSSALGSMRNSHPPTFSLRDTIGSFF